MKFGMNSISMIKSDTFVQNLTIQRHLEVLWVHTYIPTSPEKYILQSKVAPTEHFI